MVTKTHGTGRRSPIRCQNAAGTCDPLCTAWDTPNLCTRRNQSLTRTLSPVPSLMGGG